MNVLLRLTRLRHHYTNLLDQQQARGLLWMSWLTLFMLGAAALFQLGDGVPALHALYIATATIAVTDVFYAGIYVISAAGFLLTIAFVQRGSLPAARAFFVGAFYFFAFSFYLLTGLTNFLLFTVSLPIVAAGALLSRRGLFLTLILLSLSLLLLGLFTRVGLVNLVLGRALTINEVTLVTQFTLFVAGLTLAIFAGGQRLLLQRNLALTGELHSLTNVSRAIGDAQTVDDVLTRMVEMTRDELGYYHVQVFLLEERTGVLTLVAGTGIMPGSESARRRFAPDASNAFADVIRGGQTLRVTQSSPAMQRTEFLPATRTQVLVPIKRENEILGVLDVQSVQTEAFNTQDIEALEAIALQVAISIQNVRLNRAIRQSEQERQGIQEQLRTTTREIERLNQELSGRAWVHYLDARGERIVGFDVNNGAATSNTSPIPSMAEGLNPRIESRDGEQTLVVPIVSRSQPLGVMEFRAPQGQVWDDRSLELARSIAQRLALSLDNLRLFEQAQMAVAREQMANQIATLLQARNNVDSLVSVAVEAFQQALGAIQTSIHLGIPDQMIRPTVRGHTGPIALKGNGSADQ